jgi:hypothetical protein
VTPPAIAAWGRRRGGVVRQQGCHLGRGWPVGRAGGGGAVSVDQRQRRLRGGDERPRGSGGQPEVEDEPRGVQRDGS